MHILLIYVYLPFLWVGTEFYTHKIRHIMICSSTNNTGPSILETTKSTI